MDGDTIAGDIDESGAHGPDSTGSVRRPVSEPSRLKLIPFAIWLGLLAWAGEYSDLLLRKFVFGERAAWYLESMWLAALVYTVTFGLLGAGLAWLVRRRPRLRRIALAVLIGLTFLSVLLVFRSVHRLAALLLAAGLGYQLSALIVSREPFFQRVVRWTFRPAVALSAVVVVGLIVLEPVQQWRGYAALPSAEPDAPNVVFLILDTVSAHNLGLYGYGRPTTPNLESFARGAVTFDNAMAPAPWTLPSHFSFFSGLYPHEMPSGLADMRPPSIGVDRPHIAEILRERGYATAGFVANMSYTIDETGLDRGFILWDDHTVSPGQIGISTAPGRAILNSARVRRLFDWHDTPIRKPASKVTATMLGWLDRHDDRPFFVFANYFDAHNPYLPPPEFESRFVSRRPEAPLRYHPHTVMWLDETNHPEEELAAQRDMYDATIAWLDSELGVLFEAIEARGLLDNTLVVVSSDHGESFGLHGRLGHGEHVYEELLHVPLLISFRGRTPDGGLRVTDPVTLADLPATILDLIGVEDHPLPGRSLATAWDPQNPRVPASPLLSSRDAASDPAGLIDGGWHYIRNGSVEELYDLERDPDEQNNVLSDPSASAKLDSMRASFARSRSITPAQRSVSDHVGEVAPSPRAARNR